MTGLKRNHSANLNSMSILDRFRLEDKKLFIPGGSRGLGREMALAIADAGADVVLTGRNEASLEKTAADIRTLGREAFPIVADIGDPDGCEAACQKALENHRPIDILINNVGGRRVPTPTAEMPLETWRDGGAREGRAHHQYRQREQLCGYKGYWWAAL